LVSAAPHADRDASGNGAGKRARDGASDASLLDTFLEAPALVTNVADRPPSPVEPVAGAAPGASVEAVAPGGRSLDLEGLSVRFGGIRAVDDVTLSVAPGEIVGIIGPNGAGKTTLFDLISGFTTSDAGRVYLEGHDITHLSPDARARRGLGRSFQDARLFPALTVEETLAVALERWIDVKDPLNAALRLPAQQDAEYAVRQQVNELIELMGIESFRSKFVRELSTGSRRVVDLACVLAHRPSVVLLDEPSSGIAQKEAEALRPLLGRIRDNLGASLLVIEHDMPLIRSVSDRLVALDQGHVVTIGEPQAVLEHPEVVASYLGNTQEVIARSGAIK
jgi:branched-chain amino acid transport system ATP-binding protein